MGDSRQLVHRPRNDRSNSIWGEEAEPLRDQLTDHHREVSKSDYDNTGFTDAILLLTTGDPETWIVIRQSLFTSLSATVGSLVAGLCLFF